MNFGSLEYGCTIHNKRLYIDRIITLSAAGVARGRVKGIVAQPVDNGGETGVQDLLETKLQNYKIFA
jgi:hypothetical protein